MVVIATFRLRRRSLVMQHGQLVPVVKSSGFTLELCGLVFVRYLCNGWQGLAMLVCFMGIHATIATSIPN